MTKNIQRIAGNERFSQAVIHNGVVYLAGVAASDDKADIRTQTRDVLAKIEAGLARAGTDKSRLLTAQIWLSNVQRDIGALNEVWSEWVGAEALPTRATGEAKLVRSGLLVEIIVTAAV